MTLSDFERRDATGSIPVVRNFWDAMPTPTPHRLTWIDQIQRSTVTVQKRHLRSNGPAISGSGIPLFYGFLGPKYANMVHYSKDFLQDDHTM